MRDLTEEREVFFNDSFSSLSLKEKDRLCLMGSALPYVLGQRDKEKI